MRKTRGSPCQFCREQACCSPKVRKKMEDIGFGVDDRTHCFKEPSARASHREIGGGAVRRTIRGAGGEDYS